MMPSMRGKKKQNPPAAGHSPSHSGDHSAMDGDGQAGGVAALGDMDDVETTAPRKRKRGHNSSEHEDGQISPDDPNGNDDGISDGNFPEIGISPSSTS